MKKWVPFIVLLSAFTFSTFAQTSEWVLKKNKKDLEVYVRESADSPFKELKLKFNVEASMSAIVALLQDVDAIPDWVYKCTESYIVKTVNSHEELYYNLIDFPWPMDDRDMVVRNTLTQDPITKVVKSESFIAPGHIAKKEGVIRLEKLHLWWTFTPKSNGEVAIEYYLKSDPGGALPPWLVNLAIDQGPSQTIKKFRKILKTPKYKNARLDYISELKE